MATQHAFLDPDVEQYVLHDAGERLVEEVRKHWAASLFPAVRLVVAIIVFITAWAFQGPLYWIFFLAGVALGGQAGWRMLAEYRDRFVITNQRVFRVHGNLNTARATVPLSRILDITVKKPLIGHLLGFGHFVFESAAQVQGLNEIRYVANIDEREDILRKTMLGQPPLRPTDVDEDDGT